jgi:shikimate kinase
VNAGHDSQNFVLVGFMGAGKSSVGRKLSHRLSRTFVDLDREIEKSQGVPISELFSKIGEAGFREIETEALGHLEPYQSLVVSCGGGVILREQNRALLREIGRVIWLHADPAVLFERVSRSSHRPLLSVESPRAAFDRLLSERTELYRAVADITIDTTALDHDAVVDEIVLRLGGQTTAGSA